MSLLKNSWFWLIAGIVAAVSAYMICSLSTVGFIIFYILSPAAFGLAVRTCLDKCGFTGEGMNDDWQGGNGTEYEESIPLVFWT